jgi:hypothetical protein
MKVEINGQLYVPAPIPAEGKDLDAALDVRFDSDAGEKITIRDYFRRLLLKLWHENYRFDSKRPFGNSGWEIEVYRALGKAGFVELGEYDEENDEFSFTTEEQEQKAHEYCVQLIRYIFEPGN